MLFSARQLSPVVALIDFPERFVPHETSQTGVRERAYEIWRRRWLIVEEALVDGPYLLGEGLCASDLHLAILSAWDLPTEWAEQALPKVRHLASAVAGGARFQEIWPRNIPLP